MGLVFAAGLPCYLTTWNGLGWATAAESLLAFQQGLHFGYEAVTKRVKSEQMAVCAWNAVFGFQGENLRAAGMQTLMNRLQIASKA